MLQDHCIFNPMFQFLTGLNVCLLQSFLLIEHQHLFYMIKVLFEKLNHKILDYTFLKVFDCLCNESTHLKDHNKFTARARPCVFLGYESDF